jgi:hypothetical protein
VIFDGPMPFKEAVAIARRKGLLPNDLSSADLSRLEQQTIQRSIFSAHMEKASVLDVLQKNLEAILGNKRYSSRAEAKAQLRESMLAAGVPLAPVGTAPIKDFYSDTRRSLIVNTTLLDTLGFGQHVAGQDEAMLFVAPALELVRFSEPKGGDAAKRNWVQRWMDARAAIGSDAETGWTDPTKNGGRMIALKNHPIWQALGSGAGGYTDSLGNPWAPFAFNSGMGLIDVARAEAVDLGLIGKTMTIEPDKSFDMNESLEASVKNFSEQLQHELDGSGLEVLDGVLRLVRNSARRRHFIAAINARTAQLQEAA